MAIKQSLSAQEKRDLLKKGFTPDEIRQLEIQLIPSLWAETYLQDPEKPTKPLKLRYYQRDIVDCDKKKIVLRLGRRCVTEDSLVLLSNGLWKPIKDINIDDIVVSYNTDNKKLSHNKVLMKYDNGVKKTYRIHLNNNSYIDVTEDHRLYAKIKVGEYKAGRIGYGDKQLYLPKFKNKWISIKEGLKLQDKVFFIKDYNVFGNEKNITLAKFLGYMVTDGYFGKEGQTPKFTSMTYDYIKEVQELARELFGYECTIKKRDDSEAYDCWITDGNKGTLNKTNTFFKNLGLWNTKAKGKRIDEFISNWDEETVGYFINRIIAGDGCLSTWSSESRPNSGEVSITSCNFDLLNNIKMIFLKKSIHCIVKTERRKLPDSDKISIYYKLCVSDKNSVINLIDWIKPVYGKEPQTARLLQQVNNRSKCRNYKSAFPSMNIVNINNIEYIGEKKVYDIEVEKDHNFICNGFLVHNCGKSISLCIRALHKAFTTEGVRILICTPYKIQTASIWKDGFLKLIKGNKLLESAVSRIGQNPFTVEFKNGARILGLTAGSSTGNKGGSIRGASADVLILDEVDYMGEEAIQSIMAIAATNKNTEVLVSSTPTGKREFFFNCCTNKSLGFIEFYYPSSANPNWVSIEEAKKKQIPLHESQEYVFRNMYPEDVYNREYMAMFCEETQGVFKHKYIDASIVSYPGEDYSATGDKWFCGDDQKPGNIYAMGIDWNGNKVGTQIVIVEYCKTPTNITVNESDEEGKITKKTVEVYKKYRLFYRESVSLEDMTQVESISRIINLNNRFKLDHIYVDAGYGHTNYEELRLYGLKNPESQLNTKTKTINFGGKVTVYDPFSKEEIEKPMKPFSVSNSVTCLERGEVILPDSEDEKVRLIGQMREYRVLNISPTGTPRYSADNDHILDAYNLALLAFQMEYSPFVKLEHTNNVAISTKPTLLLNGLNTVPDRNININKSKLEELGVGKRQPAFNTGKYHSDSRGSHKDFEELVKQSNTTTTPFSSSPIRTGWNKLYAPKRTNF